MAAIFISHSNQDRAEAAALIVWLEKQGHASYFLDYDEQFGIDAGTNWEQVLYQRLRQCQAVIALVTPDWLESKWCFAEMIQAREKGKPIFPVITKPCQLPSLFSDTQQIDLAADRESGYRHLAAGLKRVGLDPADAFVLDPNRPPYPGFPAFEERDAAVFFGRGAELLSIREAFEGLRRQSQGVARLVLVLGSSGSGKSSLVRAGLIPRLKKDKENWLPLRPFRPQDDETNPVNALAFAIEDTYKGLGLPCDSASIRDRLNRAAASPADGCDTLRSIARELASAAGRRSATVFVTVDQAEELFNLKSGEAAKTFLRFLGASLSTGDRHLMAVATLRSDSLGVFQNQVALVDSAYRAGLVYLPLTVEPIPIERYSELIEDPARLTGFEIDGCLVRKLLQEAGQPDSLPLLAFTLRRLYDLHLEGPQANRHAALTLREYEEAGGLAGAVQNAAERICDKRTCTTEEIKALREAFIPGLITYNEEDHSYSRRRAYRDELPDKASRLLAGFVDDRILVANADKGGRATVEIAHEALLRTWPTLIGWLAQDRDKLRQHNAIVRGAKEWDESGRKVDLLVHRDGRLKDANELIRERRFAFSLGSIERAYLDACTASQQAREKAAQEERERRLRDAERVTNRTRILLAGALLAAIGWAFLWNQANIAARDARREATLASLSRADELLGLGNVPGFVAFLARAVETDPESSSATDRLWFALTQRSWPLLASPRMESQRDSYPVVDFSPDGTRIVTGSDSGLVQLWDTSISRELTAGSINHKSKVYCVSFSPDGSRFITATKDGHARVWNSLDGQPVTSGWFLQRNSIISVAFNPRASLVATGSLDHEVCVWDAASGKLLCNQSVKDGEIYSIVFHPYLANRVLVACGRAAQLLDTASGKVLLSLAHDKAVSSAQFSDDTGASILTSCDDGFARIWSAATGELSGKSPEQSGIIEKSCFNSTSGLAATASGTEVRLWSPISNTSISLKHASHVTGIAFNRNGSRLVSGCDDGTVRVWSTLDGKLLSEPIYERGHINGVAFAADDRVLVSTGGGRSSAWTLSVGVPMNRFLVHGSAVRTMAFSPDQGEFATAAEDGTIRLWGLPDGRLLQLRRESSAPFTPIAFSSDGLHFLSGTGNRVQICSTHTGAKEGETPDTGGDVTCVAFIPRGRGFATATAEGQARFWTVPECAALGDVMQHSSKITAIAFDRDGRLFITGTWDGMIGVWDVETGKEIRKLEVGTQVSCLAISPDNRLLATCASRGPAPLGELALWNLDTQERVHLHRMEHQKEIRACVFAPDSSSVATASYDGTAAVWDTTTGNARFDSLGHGGDAISAIAFSPDGRWLATGCDDGSILVWDALSGRQLSERLRHRDAVTALAFTQGGEELVSASADGRVSFWDLHTPSNTKDRQNLVQLARRLVPITLTGTGRLELRDLATFAELAKEFGDENETPVAKVVAWLEKRPLERTISPYSTQSVHDYVEGLIGENSSSTLAEAAALAGSDRVLGDKIEFARKQVNP